MTDPNDYIHPIEPREFQGNNYPAEFGLTKREYFAAMAMSNVSINDIEFGTVGAPRIDPFGWHAQKCVEFADALIAELNK